MERPWIPHHFPVSRRTFGWWILIALFVQGAGFGIYRFLYGLQASTNLNQQFPWGIWIIVDISFIALAAGGFVTAALVHVFHRHEFHALVRPALTTALLGYSFACVALAADLGRYYNIWHPMLPSMWQGNSALFEVGMCVMCYVTVLYIEFLPVFCERFLTDNRHPRLQRICRPLYAVAKKVMFIFILLGVAISCLHQSSLGHVMVLAGAKLHPFWQTPVLALFFLISAIVGGIPTVIFAYLTASWVMRVPPQMKMVAKLAKCIPFLLSIYLAIRVTDLAIRGSYLYLEELTWQSLVFMIELSVGVLLPLILLMSARLRHSPLGLSLSCLLVMFGIVLYRCSVYWLGYQPAFAEHLYFPSVAEWGLSIGVVAALLLCWRLLAGYFRIIELPEEAGTT
ncbi:MAG: putative Ni/Fe-hydrogenase 2 b-type cytochrome subunit [Phycisphaerae bacterium]|nr:putative Ni/Fe-hydrogenase 2 b-type cytochrome subunit [Phycisphaerae bacterium]